MPQVRPSQNKNIPLLLSLVILALSLAAGLRPAIQGRQAEANGAAIPGDQFSRMIREFSEENGYFRSDNFVSNETSYLHILDKLQTLGAKGGAYVGVGPEQNFTYIAKIKPEIAFIIDIRRQAVVQHLMYKALFHISENRAEFLSNLFSKPLEGEGAPGPHASIEKLVTYFDGAPTDRNIFLKNLDRIAKLIRESFRVPLNEEDLASLEYVYRTFRDRNLNIQYRSRGWRYFATLRDLVLETDLNGNRENFLAKSGDYEFLRNLHRKNRIIPLVGDFAGNKALASVAAYLKGNDYTVSAFYTSNVEQYLFGNGVFGLFAENIRKMPTTDRSLFIRAFSGRRLYHPAQATGHRLTTLLSKIQVFLEDYDKGLYRDYWSLVTTSYISAGGQSPD